MRFFLTPLKYYNTGTFKLWSYEKQIGRFYRVRSKGLIRRKITIRCRFWIFNLHFTKVKSYSWRKFYEWVHHKRYIKKKVKKETIWKQIKKELGIKDKKGNRNG